MISCFKLKLNKHFLLNIQQSVFSIPTQTTDLTSAQLGKLTHVHKIHTHYRDVQEISIHFSSTQPPFLYRWPLGQILPSRLFALLNFVIRHCLRPLSHPSAVSVPRLAVEDRFCTLNIRSLLRRGGCAAGLAAAWQTSA